MPAALLIPTAGKLGGRRLGATTTTGQPACRLFFTEDTLQGFKFLIDTGAEVSVIPHTGRKLESNVTLRAANGTPIETFGHRCLEIDIGLGSTQSWNFVLADVPFAILGIDFLSFFNLSIDVSRQRLIAHPGDTGTTSTAH